MAMKVEHCNEIRRKIEETNRGEQPGASILGHLQQCPSCLDFFEQDTNLRRLVASLAEVEAPADFDFRLRARLADERHRPRRSLPLGNFSIGIPALTFATLALLVGGIVLLPRWTNKEHSDLVQSGKDNRVVTEVTPTPQRLASVPKSLQSDESALPKENNSGEEDRVTTSRKSRPVIRDKALMVQSRPLESKDSSVTGASVVRADGTANDPQVPLSFPLQTLTVSVDDGSGVSRTISFPSVSFGSQRVLTNAPVTKDAAIKRIW
jgi:hypothetical protein